MGHTFLKYDTLYTRYTLGDTLGRMGRLAQHTLGTPWGTHSAEWALQIGTTYTWYTLGDTLGRMGNADWHNTH